jgi:hypothetical protein
VNVERVRPPPSRFDRHLGLISAFIAGALFVAIVKPWGSAGEPASVPRPTSSPHPSESPAPEPGYENRVYDPSIFGTHEPEATWAIWPAGFLVTFGFVIQVPVVPAPSPQGSAGPSHAPPTKASARPDATISPSPGEGTLAGDPVFPARFEVPPGNHLLLIGINMAPSHSLGSAEITRDPGNGATESVASRLLPSPWPAHFAVIGIPTSAGDDRLAVWPQGRYRLDMTFNPDRVTRSIEIVIVGASGSP